MNHLQINQAQIPDLARKLNHIKRLLDQSRIKHNLGELQTILKYRNALWDKMPCYIGLYHVEIMIDGRVRPCCLCNVVLGNLKDNTFREIWNSEAYQNWRQNTSSKERFERFSKQCNCMHCPYIPNNYRVHKVDRLLNLFKLIHV